MLGRPVEAQVMTPDDLAPLAGRGDAALPPFMDASYAASALEWLRQVYDGRMDCSAVATTTVEDLLGRPPVHLAAWVERNRAALLTGI